MNVENENDLKIVAKTTAVRRHFDIFIQLFQIILLSKVQIVLGYTRAKYTCKSQQ